MAGEAVIARTNWQGIARPLFVATILVGSFLLFLVQPMVARMALPRLGGASNVWNSAMIVYQSLLLAGYAYAHWISRMAMPRQGLVHLALMVLCGLSLPIALAALPAPAPGWEVLWVPLLLLATVGPIFFIVSAQAPLMQRWFSAHPAAGEPWALYAASNVGSFAGLMAYPLLAEPLLPLARQSAAWSAGYVLLVVLVAACIVARRTASFAPVEVAMAQQMPADVAPGAARIALWIALAAVPSGLMLSTTTHLTTDIFAMPLLWVIPLGLYLLSFVIAFADWRGAANAVTLAAPFLILLCGGLAMISGKAGTLTFVIASLVLLFTVATALHARMYDLRPAASRLTGFYLAMSLGGALGGAFTAIAAPVLFDWVWEHPLLVIAAAALMPLPGLLNWQRAEGMDPPVVKFSALFFTAAAALLAWWLYEVNAQGGGGIERVFLTVLLCAMGLMLIAWRTVFMGVLAALMLAQGGAETIETSMNGWRTRSYFGIYTVQDYPDFGLRRLVHGTTLHGEQYTGSDREREPSTYYGPQSGAGLALSGAPVLYGRNARIGVVGLGTGTLACQRQDGQSWTFFEIDPAVVKMSRDGTFTYVSNCAPNARIAVGDARLTLADEPPGTFDVLAIDAFSSDAIPLHLLTREALGVYFSALAEDGIAVLHISNRYIDLEPVVAAIVDDLGLAAAIRTDNPENLTTLTRSSWIALARRPATLERLEQVHPDAPWQSLPPARGSAWTDDYASILPFIRWNYLLGAL